MSMSKLVNVTNIQQLIDLNRELVNFKLDFKVFSENNEPFKAIVITQSKLDTEEIINFKNVDNGIITGNIVSDNGIKQSYYLVLKSDNPTKCTIEINLEEIPLNKKIQEEYQREQQEEYQRKQKEYENKQSTDVQLHKKETSNKNDKKSFFNLKTILFLLVIVGGIIFYYLFYIKKAGGGQTKSQIGEIPTIVEMPVIIPPKAIDLGESIPLFNDSLLSRLNNIQMY